MSPQCGRHDAAITTLLLAFVCRLTDHCVAVRTVDAGSALEATPSEHRTVEPRQRPSARHMNGTRSSRMVTPRIPTASQLSYQQAMLLQVSMRMHRNNPMLHTMPLTSRQPVRIEPVPQDWITERNLRPKRLPVARVNTDDSYIASAESDEPDDASVNSKAQEARNDGITERKLKPKRSPVARVDRDDSYIVSAESKPDDALKNTMAQEALPWVDAETQEPLPAAAKRQSTAPPPVVTIQIQNTRRRRRTTASVENNNALVNDSSPSANKNDEPQLIDFAVPASVGKETDMDSVSNATMVRQPAPSRPSMIFEKVEVAIPEPVVRNRRRTTERHLPLHESSV